METVLVGRANSRLASATLLLKSDGDLQAVGDDAEEFGFGGCYCAIVADDFCAGVDDLHAALH